MEKEVAHLLIEKTVLEKWKFQGFFYCGKTLFKKFFYYSIFSRISVCPRHERGSQMVFSKALAQRGGDPL